MSESNRPDDSWSFERRTALKLAGGLVLGGASTGSAVAGGRARTEHTCYVKQGGKAYEIEPLSGDVPAEELYDYRLPGKYEGVGVTSNDGPHYRSLGTKDLQKERTSVMFLYDGPDGLSFVVVHGRPGGKGGSVSWKVTSVPARAKWTVKDDLYVDADTGERVETNYDKWETKGTKHRIDWTWGSHGTDGGVLSDLGKTFSFTIHPAFNEDAELYGEHYSGRVKQWQILSGDLDDPDRASLWLDKPVTVACKTSKQKQSWVHEWDDDEDWDDHDKDRDGDHDKDRDRDDDHDKDRDRDDDHDKDRDDDRDKGDEDRDGHRDDEGDGRDGKKGGDDGNGGHDRPADDSDGGSTPRQSQSQTQKQSQYQSGSGGTQKQSQKQSQKQVQSGNGGTQKQSQAQSQKQVQSGSGGTQVQSQSQSQTQVQSSGGTQKQSQSQSQKQVQKLLNKVTGDDD